MTTALKEKHEKYLRTRVRRLDKYLDVFPNPVYPCPAPFLFLRLERIRYHFPHLAFDGDLVEAGTLGVESNDIYISTGSPSQGPRFPDPEDPATLSPHRCKASRADSRRRRVDAAKLLLTRHELTWARPMPSAVYGRDHPRNAKNETLGGTNHTRIPWHFEHGSSQQNLIGLEKMKVGNKTGNRTSYF